MNNNITISFSESILLYNLLLDRIKDCERYYDTSIMYDDKEGAAYWDKEKTVAIELQHRLDGVI